MHRRMLPIKSLQKTLLTKNCSKLNYTCDLLHLIVPEQKIN